MPHGVADVQLVTVGQVVRVGVELAHRERELRVVRGIDLVEVERLRHVLQEGSERNGVRALRDRGVALRIHRRRGGLSRGRVVAVEVIDRRVHHHHVRHVAVGIAVRHANAVHRRAHVELAVHAEHVVNSVALLREAILEAGVHHVPVRDNDAVVGGVRRDHHLQVGHHVRHHVLLAREACVVEQRVGADGHLITIRDAVHVGVGQVGIGADVKLGVVAEAVAVGVVVGMLALHGRASLDLRLEVLGDVKDVVRVPIGVLEVHDHVRRADVRLDRKRVEAGLVKSELGRVAPRVVRHAHLVVRAAVRRILHVPSRNVVRPVRLDKERCRAALRVRDSERLAKVWRPERADHEVLGRNHLSRRRVHDLDADCAGERHAVVHLEDTRGGPARFILGNVHELVVAERHLVRDLHAVREHEVRDGDRVESVDRRGQSLDRVRGPVRAAVGRDGEPVLRHARRGRERHRVGHVRVGALDRRGRVHDVGRRDGARSAEGHRERVAGDSVRGGEDVLGAEHDGVGHGVNRGKRDVELRGVGLKPLRLEARREVAVLERRPVGVAGEVVAPHHARRAGDAVDRGADDACARGPAVRAKHGPADREHRVGVAKRNLHVCAGPADDRIAIASRTGLVGRREVRLARQQHASRRLAKGRAENRAHPVGGADGPCGRGHCGSLRVCLDRDRGLILRAEDHGDLRHRHEGLEAVAAGVRHAVAGDAPEVPAALVRAGAGVHEVGDAERIAHDGLDELRAVEELAEVGRVVGGRAEVVVRRSIGHRVRHGEVVERRLVAPPRQHFLPVGEAVEVLVLHEVAVEEAEPDRLVVVELEVFVLAEERPDAPGVPRIEAVSLLLRYGRDAVELRVDVVSPERRDAGGRLAPDGVRAEHHVELPAVRDAVAVVIHASGLKRVLPTLVGRLYGHVLLRREADRGEVVGEVVLVVGRHGLRVHRVERVRGRRCRSVNRTGVGRSRYSESEGRVRRGRVVSEDGVHGGVDGDHLVGGNAHRREARALRHVRGRAESPHPVVGGAVLEHPECLPDVILRLAAVERLAVVDDRHDRVGVASQRAERHAVGNVRVGHHRAVPVVRVHVERILRGATNLQFPAIRDAVAVRIPNGRVGAGGERVGRVAEVVDVGLLPVGEAVVVLVVVVVLRAGGLVVAVGAEAGGLSLEVFVDVEDVVLVPVGVLEVHDHVRGAHVGLDGERVEAGDVASELGGVAPRIVRHPHLHAAAAVVSVIHVPCGHVVVLVRLNRDGGGVLAVVKRRHVREGDLAEVGRPRHADNQLRRVKRNRGGGILDRHVDRARERHAAVHLEAALGGPAVLGLGQVHELVVAEAHLVGHLHVLLEREVRDGHGIDAADGRRQRRHVVRDPSIGLVVPHRQPVLRHAAVGGELHHVLSVLVLDRRSGVLDHRDRHAARAREVDREGIALDERRVAVDVRRADHDGVGHGVDRADADLDGVLHEEVLPLETGREVRSLKDGLRGGAGEVEAPHHALPERLAVLLADAVDGGAHNPDARGLAVTVKDRVADREHLARLAERDVNVRAGPADGHHRATGGAGGVGRREAHLARQQSAEVRLAERRVQHAVHPLAVVLAGTDVGPFRKERGGADLVGPQGHRSDLGHAERELHLRHELLHDLKAVRALVRVGVAGLVPEPPAALVRARAGVHQLVHAQCLAGNRLDELAAVERLAEVRAAGLDEVVERHVVAHRLHYVERHVVRGLRRQELLVVGKSVVVLVLHEVAVADPVLARLGVGVRHHAVLVRQAVEEEVLVPRIGRVTALVEAGDGLAEVLARERERQVAGPVRGGREADVQLPAVRQAVRVGVDELRVEPEVDVEELLEVQLLGHFLPCGRERNRVGAVDGYSRRFAVLAHDGARDGRHRRGRVEAEPVIHRRVQQHHVGGDRRAELSCNERRVRINAAHHDRAVREGHGPVEVGRDHRALLVRDRVDRVCHAVGDSELRCNLGVGHHVHRVGLAPVPAGRHPAVGDRLGVRERSKRAVHLGLRLEQRPVEEILVVRVERSPHRIVAVGGAGRAEVEGQCRVVPHGVADVQLVAVWQVVRVGVELVDREREVVRRVAELLEVVLLRDVLQVRRERNSVNALRGRRVAIGVNGRGAGLRRGRVVAVEVVHRRVHHHHVGRHVAVHVAVRGHRTVGRCADEELAVHLEHGVNGVAHLRVAVLKAGVDHEPVGHGARRVGGDHDGQGVFLVRHHVVRAGEVGVGEERVGAGLDLEAVRQAVAVRIGILGIGAIVVLLGVGESVAVRIGVGSNRFLGLDLRRGNPAVKSGLFEAVGRPVLVDVRIFHHEERGGRHRLRGLHLECGGRPLVRGVRADLVHVAPALPRVALEVAVGVDERHQVVGAGRDAVEHDVGADNVERLCEVVRECGDGIAANEVLAGDRLGREVGRFIHANDDVGEGCRRRAEVAHFGCDAAIARIGVLNVHRSAERRNRAPVAVRYSVNGRDAPEVVLAILKLVAHVEVGLELAAIRRGERHEVRGGVDDFAEGVVLRHLEHERGSTFRRLPHERGTRGFVHVDMVLGCAGRRGRDELGRERAREGVDRRGIAPVEIDRVADGADVRRRNAGCERIRDEVRLVKVVLAVLEEVGLGEGLALAEINSLRIDRARFRERRAIDGGALDAHARGVIGLRTDIERDCIGAERNFNVHVVEADVRLGKASLCAARHDERVETLLQAAAQNLAVTV